MLLAGAQQTPMRRSRRTIASIDLGNIGKNEGANTPHDPAREDENVCNEAGADVFMFRAPMV
jgi:hypothetical protein